MVVICTENLHSPGFNPQHSQTKEKENKPQKLELLLGAGVRNLLESLFCGSWCWGSNPVPLCHQDTLDATLQRFFLSHKGNPNMRK